MSDALEEFRGAYLEFDWDERKRAVTLEERGIDFAYVARYFFGRVPFFRLPTGRNGQPRWQALGQFVGVELLSVVYEELENGTVCRIISVRAASLKERANYYAAIQGR